jgi:hypothetical protein
MLITKNANKENNKGRNKYQGKNKYINFRNKQICGKKIELSKIIFK